MTVMESICSLKSCSARNMTAMPLLAVTPKKIKWNSHGDTNTYLDTIMKLRLQQCKSVSLKWLCLGAELIIIPFR